MADGPTPAQNAKKSYENFHDAACSAGERLKRRLYENFESGNKTPGIVSFEMLPCDGILEEVKAQFVTKVGRITIACKVNK
jgi:hypothetical protein